MTVPPVIMQLANTARTMFFGVVGLRTLGAMVLLVDDNNHVFLVRQTYGTGQWTLPGGGVQRGESFAEAAVREAQEEAGVVLRSSGEVRLFGLYHRRQMRWSDYIALYVLTHWDANPVANSEVYEFGRFDPRDLPRDISVAARNRIEEWLGLAPRSTDW